MPDCRDAVWNVVYTLGARLHRRPVQLGLQTTVCRRYLSKSNHKLSIASFAFVKVHTEKTSERAPVSLGSSWLGCARDSQVTESSQFRISFDTAFNCRNVSIFAELKIR